MKYLSLSLLLFLPVVASAQLNQIVGIASGIAEIVKIIVPVMIGLAFIYFVWGIIKYVLAKDPEKQKEAKSTIFWGIIALTAIVGVWAIAYFILGQLGVDPDGVQDLVMPRVQ